MKSYNNTYKIIFFIGSLIIFFLYITTSNIEATIIYDRTNTINIRVSSGDTLWSIASRHHDNKSDIREFIHKIKYINKLDHSCTLYPGQNIMIPIYNK